MKKYLKKSLFYVISLVIWILHYFQVNWAISIYKWDDFVPSLYWPPVHYTPIEARISNLYTTIMVIIAPIIFIIWLYYYFVKKSEKDKKKGIKYMLIAFLVCIISFILVSIIEWLINIV